MIEHSPACPQCGGYHANADPDVDYPASCVFAFTDWRGPAPFRCPTRTYSTSIPREEYIRLLLLGAECPRLHTATGDVVYCGWCAYETSGLSPRPATRTAAPPPKKEAHRPSITPRNDLRL